MTYHTTTPQQTEQVGHDFAQSLQSGDIIAYRGDLGAGKTAMTRGIARGLGFSGEVTSPTFTIVHEYLGGRLPIFHFDLYRIEHEDELFNLGFDDYLVRGGVCIIEWSERITTTLANEAVIDICLTSNGDNRDIVITSSN